MLNETFYLIFKHRVKEERRGNNAAREPKSDKCHILTLQGVLENFIYSLWKTFLVCCLKVKNNFSSGKTFSFCQTFVHCSAVNSLKAQILS